MNSWRLHQAGTAPPCTQKRFIFLLTVLVAGALLALEAWSLACKPYVPSQTHLLHCDAPAPLRSLLLDHFAQQVSEVAPPLADGWRRNPQAEWRTRRRRVSRLGWLL